METSQTTHNGQEQENEGMSKQIHFFLFFSGSGRHFPPFPPDIIHNGSEFGSTGS